MNRGAQVAIAVTVLTCGSAIAQGIWNESGPDTASVTLVLGREGKLVSGGTRNSATSVRLWLGPKEATSVPVADQAWLDSAGFGVPGPIATTRHGYAVLDVGTAPGANGLSVVAVGREPAGLLERHADRTRYIIARAAIRQREAGASGGELGTVYLTPNALHVPTGLHVGERVQVRTGRSGIPFVVGGRERERAGVR